MIIKKSIVTSICPNIEIDDFNLVKNLLNKSIDSTNSLDKLKSYFLNNFSYKSCYLLDSARSSLFLVLKYLLSEKIIPQNAKVLVQGFTCVAVPNSILWNNLNINYVDIDNTFNMDINDLKKKLDSDTKVIIIQNSFGNPDNILEISKICKEKGIILIEDAAHSLGMNYEDSIKLGDKSDITIFSFGRDKVISTANGGVLCFSKNSTIDFTSFDKYYNSIQDSTEKYVQQQLRNVYLLFNILPIYSTKLAKLIIVLAQKTKYIGKAVENEEKLYGSKPSNIPSKMDKRIATLALNQLNKLEKFIKHRIEISKIYDSHLKEEFRYKPKSNCTYLRYTIKSKNRNQLLLQARLQKDKSIYLGDWFDKVIAPKETNLDNINYKIGTCPVAEDSAKYALNLPTHINITKDDAIIISNFINSNANA